MTFLFDSSAIIDLCSKKKADKLMEGSSLELAFYEIGNAVWKQVFLHKILTLNEGNTALEVLIEVLKRIRKIPINNYLGVLKIAVKEGLTYYDAAYLLTAIESDKTLVTNDEKLYTAAKKYVKTITSDQL